MIRAAIAGGSGYGGGELLRLLAGHPEVEIAGASSRKYAGRPVHTVHENLAGVLDLTFTDDFRKLEGLDLLFFALPHGEAAARSAELREWWPEARVIDLSGDFRLDSAADWEAAYGREHPDPQAVGDYVYGLTELHREEIRSARLVANPGCFATGSILALLPIAKAGLLTGNVVSNGVTGSSGSGVEPKATTHHPGRAEDFRAYRPLRHQHVPEIRMALARAGAGPLEVAMVAHSAPIVRGIFTTAYVFPEEPVPAERLTDLYESVYLAEPFVRLREGTPRVAVVKATNFCDVAVAANEDGRRIVAMSAIDNLGKGMAGQAVQNMNLMFGLPETTGLEFPGTHP